MMLRGGRFYLRRHVPTDIQPIIRRAEVWRSLKTDSLQIALRRLPLMTAALESEFERIRHDAGLTVDETLLRLSEDDLGGRLNPAEAEPLKGAAPELLTLAHACARYMDRKSVPQASLTPSRLAIGQAICCPSITGLRFSRRLGSIASMESTSICPDSQMPFSAISLSVASSSRLPYSITFTPALIA
jgi:hypothetical protein